METKDFLIGVLLIGMVSVAGWVGFLYVNPPTKTIKKTDEETKYIYIEVPPTYDSGLPDDWSNAPNSSKIILYNETGDVVEITLGQILDYVNKYEETSQEKYWWEKRLEPLTVDNPSGIPVTGVDILELLRVFDCLYASELEFVSHNDTASKLRMDVVEMSNLISDDKNIILGIAANKQWLNASPLASRSGDFMILGKDTSVDEEIEYTCYDLETIRVTKNWTIAVKVYNDDGSENQTLILNYDNLTSTATEKYHYEYENTDYWSFNRSYYGTNVSQIVDYTEAKGTNYVLNFTFSDGGSQPSNKSRREVYSYAIHFNSTDVEVGLAHNGTHVIGNHVDLVNGSIPMLKSDLKMCIAHKIKFGYEFYDHPIAGKLYNSPWDQFYNDGYPPFQLIIPGASRSRFYNGLSEITITILGP